VVPDDIVVTYEQERGLRKKHQKADGYAVSAQAGQLRFQ
jgi:hypothetical protein